VEYLVRTVGDSQKEILETAAHVLFGNGYDFRVMINPDQRGLTSFFVAGKIQDSDLTRMAELGVEVFQKFVPEPSDDSKFTPAY